MRIMTRFNNKILLIVLAVLLGGFVLSKVFRSPARESNLKETVLKLDTGKISAIHITPATEKLHEIKLVRSAKGWNIENGKHTVNADISQVKNALRSLSEIHPDRMLTRSKDKWGTYKVDTTGTRIKIFAGDEPSAELLVGRTNSGASAVRVGANEEVYEVQEPLDAYFNKSVSVWRDKSFSRLQPEKVTTIAFQYPGDSSFVLKLEKNIWRADNLEADSAKVENYLNKLRSRTISTFADDFIPQFDASHGIAFSDASGKILSVEGWSSQDKVWVLSSTLQPGVYFSTRDSSLVRDLFPGRKSFLKK
jgi:hypothetical protein